MHINVISKIRNLDSSTFPFIKYISTLFSAFSFTLKTQCRTNRIVKSVYVCFLVILKELLMKIFILLFRKRTLSFLQIKRSIFLSAVISYLPLIVTNNLIHTLLWARTWLGLESRLSSWKKEVKILQTFLVIKTMFDWIRYFSALHLRFGCQSQPNLPKLNNSHSRCGRRHTWAWRDINHSGVYSIMVNMLLLLHN